MEGTDRKGKAKKTLDKEKEITVEKERRNAEYLQKLDRAFKQLYEGKGQEHDLL